mmetsp:Transcript_32400/g.64207  ORF Transcript_32400/g.64207 Transcript_32400/m.64207 type:complete len:276 (+) Transcript_32400:1951-2778(+)
MPGCPHAMSRLVRYTSPMSSRACRSTPAVVPARPRNSRPATASSLMALRIPPTALPKALEMEDATASTRATISCCRSPAPFPPDRGDADAEGESLRASPMASVAFFDVAARASPARWRLERRPDTHCGCCCGCCCCCGGGGSVRPRGCGGAASGTAAATAAGSTAPVPNSIVTSSLDDPAAPSAVVSAAAAAEVAARSRSCSACIFSCCSRSCSPACRAASCAARDASPAARAAASAEDFMVEAKLSHMMLEGTRIYMVVLQSYFFRLCIYLEER